MQPINRLAVVVLMGSLFLASSPANSHAVSVQPLEGKASAVRKSCGSDGSRVCARVQVLARAGHTTARALGLVVRETAEAIRLVDRGRITPRPAAAPRGR